MKEKEPKKSSIKSLLLSMAIFVVLLIVSFWLIFKDQDLGEIIEVIVGANLLWILVGLIIMVGYFLMQAWNMKSILASFGEKLTLRKSLKFTFIEFFFCAMTPSATGGQPVEIYYMSKEGISASAATMAVFVQLCGFQIAVMTYGVLSVIFLPYKLPSIVFMFFTIGLLINAAVLVVLLTCVFSQGVARTVSGFVVKIAKKLNYKKVDKMQEKMDEGLKQYAKSAEYIKKHKKEFGKAIARVFVQVGLYYLVPFCVYMAFGLDGHHVFEIFAMQSVVFLSTAGIPIPGAVGISETIFLALYGTVFGAELLRSAMLLNRGITFYWFVLVSMFVVVANVLFVRFKLKLNKEKASEDKRIE